MTTPMSAELFSDRFRCYHDQPPRQRGRQIVIAARQQGSIKTPITPCIPTVLGLHRAAADAA
jgi:hypothetical protein